MGVLLLLFVGFFGVFFLPKVYFLWLELQAFFLGVRVSHLLHSYQEGFQRNLKWESQSNRVRCHKCHTIIKAEGRKHIKRPLLQEEK